MPNPVPRVMLPRRRVDPTRQLMGRVAIALAVVVFVALVTWLGRDGYRDIDGDPVSLLDAFYYATVSVTTTGYGDVIPVSEGARAATTLVSTGTPPDQIVVVDQSGAPLEEARVAGFTTVQGDATRTVVLQKAQVTEARTVIVTTERDDTATLVTLTARELNPSAGIVAAVRETENAHLLRQSGANAVIVSSEASGRLLGLAAGKPRVVEVIEDLIVAGRGLMLEERAPRPDEVGGSPRTVDGALPITIVRGDDHIPFDAPEFRDVRPGDVIVCLCRE